MQPPGLLAETTESAALSTITVTPPMHRIAARSHTMKRFESSGPALVALLVGLLAMVFAPVIVSRVLHAQTQARVTQARQSLDADNILERINRLVADLADAVEPSVVHIQGRESEDGRSLSAGAGWIYDDKGHIVTNAHVVRGAERVSVQFYDGRETSGTLLGDDPSTDVAVIRVDDVSALTPARRATGAPLRRGERVYAFGSPFGFKFSMTEGIISGLGRDALGPMGWGGYTNFIQTDAAVNPGNSGGPLVDVRGRVIGMNTAIVNADNPEARLDARNQSAGVGFAVPLETIESVAEQIIARGEVLKGYLGVSLGELRFFDEAQSPAADAPAVHRGPGVFVRSVIPGSPGDRGGLRAGDVVTRFDGEAVRETAVLRARISSRRPGDAVRLTVMRSADELTLTVTLGAARVEGRGRLTPIESP